MLAREYFNKISEILEQIEKTQIGEISKAADLVADIIDKNGLIHAFGTGHSHILAEEIFGRAGGFAPINAMLEPSLMLHNGLKYSQLENLEGYGSILFRYYEISEDDILIIISNSGVNVVPVEMALTSKDKGIKTIAVTSLQYCKFANSNHSSGKKLYEIADIVIDNNGIPGDALMDIDGVPQKVGPTSTITGALILHSLFVQVAGILADKNEEIPVFMSSNLEKAGENNKYLFAKYKNRIKHF